MKKSCKVPRQTDLTIGTADWDQFPWKEIPSQEIQNPMGTQPDHFPSTRVKIAYDDTIIYLMFQVVDRYVRAMAREDQDNVWEDSCVEFFFTPGSDVSRGYFNLEMNCGGTLLFHFQPGSGRERRVIPPKECARIMRAHSLPQRVDPEIQDPVTWTVAYGIPLALLKTYCRVEMPGPGVEWQGNFYKCADKSSHPHWLTWAPVHFPKPNFHLPQFFGILQFQ